MLKLEILGYKRSIGSMVEHLSPMLENRRLWVRVPCRSTFFCRAVTLSILLQFVVLINIRSICVLIFATGTSFPAQCQLIRCCCGNRIYFCGHGASSLVVPYTVHLTQHSTKGFTLSYHQGRGKNINRFFLVAKSV